MYMQNCDYTDQYIGSKFLIDPYSAYINEMASFRWLGNNLTFPATMQTGGIDMLDHTEYLLDNHVITEYLNVIVYTYMYINDTSVISTWGSKYFNFVIPVGIFWSSSDNT